MAISKLLEMTYISEHRAVLSQANVDAIREFDEELADVSEDLPASRGGAATSGASCITSLSSLRRCWYRIFSRAARAKMRRSVDDKIGG